MKKILLFCIGIFFCMRLSAQPMITGNTTNVKLSEVIAKYKSTHPGYGVKSNNIVNHILPGLPKEKDEKDYQFDRWLWYWRQHLDGNGYMVSPAKTWQEWQKQQATAHSAARKTTEGGPLGDWSFQGPDSSGADGNGVGRINVITFHPTDVNTYWIGSPGGGAWMTNNSGATWTCMTDQLPLLSISDIKYNPLNPSTIYLCTGDRDGQDYYGVGLLKSYNGGTTWNTTGITWTTSQFNIANNLLVNPLDTNSLLLATTIGIEQSFDGGNTWASVGPSGNFYQLLYCPGDTNIVYATSFNYAGGGQIYRSANAGMTWTQVSSFSEIDRISLAVTPANPAIVKALCSSSSAGNEDGLAGIYSSSDTGNTFTEIFTPTDCNTGHDNLLSFNSDGTQCTGQGWYDLPIAISPTNEDTVYIGGVNTWSSANGGASWKIVNQWNPYYPGGGLVSGVIAIHADKHFMGFNPLLPGVFFESNDGGIYASSTPLSSSVSSVWNNQTNGIGITEIYRTAVSNTANYELLGAQDVGSKLVYPSSYFEADDGDGMVCHIDPVDTTVGYTSVYNGYIDQQPAINPSTIPNLPNLTNDISYNIDNGNVEGTGGWITPFILEPACHTCIDAAYDSVYRSTDQGNTWTTISSQLTTSAGYGDLLRVVGTVADPNTLYVAEDGTENIFYTHDLGTSWTTITAPYGSTAYPNSDIKVDPRDANHIWVTFTGYGSPQVAEWSLSGGWTQMNTGLPDVPVGCIEIDTSNRDLYVGTDIGVYFMDTTMTSWVPYTFGMPSLMVTDLEINYGTNEIWASTFGRSLWKSGTHIIVSVSSIPSVVPFVADGIIVSPNPNHGNFTVTVKNIADQLVTMRLTDANGKTVWLGSGMLSSGKMDVHTQGLVAGTYIFEIDADGSVQGRQKLLIY